MRPLLLVAAVLMLALGSVAAQDSVDWSDCLACHGDMITELPVLSTFRINAPGTPLPDCRGCHEPADLSMLRTQWTHPVRAVADHLACTQCHVAVEHGSDQPPPRPSGDYAATGCYECHPAVEL